MSPNIDPERMKKLDRTIGDLGITGLTAHKKNQLWIIEIKADDVVAITSGEKFSSVLARAIEQLFELRLRGMKSLMS